MNRIHWSLKFYLKKELTWLKEIDSISLQQTLRDLDSSFKNFFRGLKKGIKVGFPKFKSKRNNKSSYRTQNSKLPKLDAKIGIDVGLSSFLTTNEGIEYSNPRFLTSLEKKLKFRQRSLSRKKLNSKNWYKQKLVVVRIHEHIKNTRLDFLHKLFSKLIRENQIICMEDLDVKEMLQNKKLAKSISEASWSEF